MSLQWDVISTILILETVATLLLTLPFISSSAWRVLFQSGLAKALSRSANYVMTVFFVLLGVVFADSVREMMRYRHSEVDESSFANNPNAVANVHMKLFRAQRNFLIAGYSLFLVLVEWRLVKLISSEAKLKASEQAAIKQAKSASETASLLMDKSKQQSSKDDDEESKEMDKLRKALALAQQEVKSKDADLEAIKKQAESTNREYDRLSSEFQALQQQMSQSEDKKTS
ncbi:B-cell receptor-associated protein 31-like [Watersipora subatra]|uniref:B-cell receptor-associated protein 31-like n=1 Tax=Watersipora subatra TaxID=2589382 RepID=UPI00355BF86E